MGTEDQDLVQACEIYRKAHPKIQKLTEELNRATDYQGKANKAKFLLDEAQALIDCEKRGTLTVCPACGTINKVRKQTAELIMRAGKLA
jgi:hypothetical protein